MQYQVFYTHESDKQLAKLAKADIKRVIQKTKSLAIPFPGNLDIKKMVNTHNFFRLRIGKVRVIFEVDTKSYEIWIRKIKYRGDVYK